MTSQETTDLPDFSLVSWRRGGDTDFAGGLVHGGQLWSLADVPGIDGDVLARLPGRPETAGMSASQNGSSAELTVVSRR